MAGPGAELVTLLARRGGGRRGAGAAEELVKWANRAVEAGFDDPSVCALAGETRPFYSSEVDEMLAAVLDALHLPEPTSQDELLDAELVIACQRGLSGEISPDEVLSVAAQVVIESIYARRFGGWIELVEDASLMAYGDGPHFVAGLTLENLPEYIVEAARRTCDEMQPPLWLAAYLALDTGTEADRPD